MIIAQISDPHITLKRSNAAATHLQRAVEHLKGLPVPPDVVMVSGDCVNTGQLAEYAYFQELLSPLPMPVYVIPGNHDNRQQMLAVFGPQGSSPLNDFVQYVVDVGALRLIALDTHILGREAGVLCDERLRWLDARLTEASDRPTLIFMHHQPIHIGLTPMDQVSLVNADVFEELIARHHQVERIVTGHVHMAFLRRFAGTLLMSCPSTAHTMLPDLSKPAVFDVVMEPPACLLHAWSDTTGLVTYTSQINESKSLTHLHDGVRWLPQS